MPVPEENRPQTHTTDDVLGVSKARRRGGTRARHTGGDGTAAREPRSGSRGRDASCGSDRAADEPAVGRELREAMERHDTSRDDFA